MSFYRLILFFIIGLLYPIFLTADGNISGTVTVVQTGDPISGATIRVIKGNNQIVATTMTAPDGTYSIIGIKNGNYTVQASSSGLQTGSIGAKVQNNQTTIVNLALIQNPGSISGTVTDTSMPAMPISGALVEVFQNQIEIGSALTDIGGNYTVSGLPPGYSVVTASSTGFQTASMGATVVSEEIVTVNFALVVNSGTVLGTVKDGSMTGIGGALVELIISNQVIYSTTTDNAGNYLIAGVAPGSYVIEAQAESFQTEMRGITVNAGMATTADFVLGTSFGTLEGAVVSASSGQPIAGALVEVIANGTVINFELTDAAGNYSFDGVPPGSYLVEAQAANFQTAMTGAIIQPGMTTTVDFALQSSFGIISGHVVSDDTGQPIAGAFIEVEFDDQVVFSAITDASGNYTISGVPPGSYEINAYATNFQTETQAAFVQSGQTTVVNFSLLSNPAIMQGQVTDSNTHLPISGALVQLKLNNIPINHALTDSNGNYRITGLAAGSYVAECHAAQYEIAVQNVQFAAGEAKTVDFALISGGGDVSGIITNKLTGLPISDAKVEVILNNIAIESTVTDPSGNYDLPDLPPGSYVIQASKTGFYTANQSFSLSASEVKTINLSLIPDSPPKNLTGRVINNRFLLQADRIHHIQWEASQDTTVTEYQVFRNGMLLAVISSTSPLMYDDHNRSQSVTDVYTVNDQNSNGDMSSFATITLR
ncbi:MAG TPA: carboxypeptidase-like regulatory domain-containing protein [Rhabdochlamydiaceae bacterium]|nr:carboxypeptidase-like regulatory domain-containing protein [Rhabdochlamydiaceae bacterium]